MDDILEKAIAKILFNKLMYCFDNIEMLTQVQSSNDFKIIKELESKLNDDRKIQNIDYQLVSDAWNYIYDSIKKLNKENLDLIEYVSDEFKVNIRDDFFISGTLYDFEKFFIKKFNSSWNETYKEYLSQLDDIICEFRLKLLQYENSYNQDKFFDDISKINKMDIKYKKTSPICNSVYLDNNAIQVFSNDERLRRIAKKIDINFVYSSYTIEDAANSNPVFIKPFIKDLLSISDGNMVGYMDEGLCFVKENITDTLNRVNKYSKMTKLFEKTNLNDCIKHYHLYPELRKGKEINNKLSSDFIEFFKSENKENILGFKLVKSNFENTVISEFVENGHIGKINDVREVIDKFNELLDFVNFETENINFSNLKKIASSYRDRQHMEHAYLCDYFVTDDARLNKRAKLIYKIIGVKTKVININEFRTIIKSSCV